MRAWRDIQAEWEADPAFRAAYAMEYPFEAQALAVVSKRASVGMTQEQYAAHMGVTLRTLRRYESAKVLPPERFR